MLGLTVEEVGRPNGARHPATVPMPGGIRLELDSAEFAKQWNPGWREDVRRPGCVLFFAVSSRDTCGRNFSQDGRRRLRVAAGSGRWISGGAIRHLLRSGWQLDRYYESHRSRQAAHAASASLGKRCGAADFECHIGPVAPSTPTAESVLVVVGRVAAKAAEYDVLQTLVASNSASLFQTRRDWRNGWLKRERAVKNGIVGPQDRPTEHNVRASAGPWQPTPLSSQRGG